MARNPKTYGLNFYTKTTHTKVGKTYVPKMLGVIEGPVNKMIRLYIPLTKSSNNPVKIHYIIQ